MSKANDVEPAGVCCNSSADKGLVEKPATLEEWREKAEKLWAMLDDIDTYGDVFKPKASAYFAAVNNKAAERHDILKSDGYKILNT